MVPPPRMPIASSAWRRRHLELCWLMECDIDPLILRARLLHRYRAEALARCIEQELLPIV
ncbi:hypothetical protein [Cyanobium sp. LEGE 06113]|uniref:hypothetical protein n=1 Tax=Cyanobium sp. LEGE 06113 TaxID=1297573 RepID=UPI0018815F0F|nr:hypothetical protein [Cyanobium sp. LEGE 06113]MBE9155145.1 hypothetical protein [Cyanobium sp. LEGE 06113]